MSHTEDEADEIPQDGSEFYEEMYGEEGEGWLKEEYQEKMDVERFEMAEGGDEDQEQYFYDDRSDLQKGIKWVRGDWGEEDEHYKGVEISESESSRYDPEDYISWPSISPEGTIPIDILTFDFSYGYNCRKYFNLCMIDENVVVFGSGNYIHFYNIETKEIWFRRSALGGGIGHIRKNPNEEYSHLAVAESGKTPIIILYEWPNMDIFAVLKEGTTRSYSNIDYSPDGMLLVSQGGEPDYNITVWNWPKKIILLRTKSYVNDVYKVMFSPYVPGQLTTCGVAHIKFWKMALTFTGLKLKGEVGRFGKTEYSDIIGVYPMPDGKVISGSSWGNILIWDDGLIKLEVLRTQRKTCHDEPIVQMNYNGAELWTISMDGHVKVWWYEKIDHADPPDEDRVVLVEPNFDFYTPGVMLMFLEKRFPNDQTNTEFIAQDGMGGIWRIDLNTETTPAPPVQLYNCHGGRVMDVATCPYDHYLVSLGNEGKLFVYDYISKEILYMHRFDANGTCLMWLPVEIQACGDEIIAGFDDGQLRICLISINGTNTKLKVVQIVKPHNKPVIAMSVNALGNVLVTAGEDNTIFVFCLSTENQLTVLLPVGYILTPDRVTCITWCPKQPYEVLLGCYHGHMMQVEVPNTPQSYTTISYLLDIKPKQNRFYTYKAQIRRDIKIMEIEARKAEKVERKKKEMERIKRENPGLSIDEDVFLADSDSEEELEPLHIPEEPNRILWLKYTERDTIWLSMAGYDAGYIYEHYIDQMDTKPIRFKIIADADDTEINSYVYSYKNQYLFFAMQDGSIRINRVNPLDYTDLSDYWIFTMHDNLNGFITKMCFSCDEKYFFSCGHDGNLFAYAFNPQQYDRKKVYHILLPNQRTEDVAAISEDKGGYERLSLEETIVKAEEDRINRVANNHKTKTRQTIHKMQLLYESILERNEKLLASQRIPWDQLEIDKRVTEFIDQQLEGKIALVKRKLAYDVEKSFIRLKKIKNFIVEPLDYFPITIKAINSPEQVTSLRQKQLPQNLGEIMEKIEERLLEEEAKGRKQERIAPGSKYQEFRREIEMEKEYFLLSLSQDTIQNKLGPRLTRMLDNYRRRIVKWKHRQVEWEIFNSKKPKADVNHPADEIAYAEAQSTIGDYLLKTDENYIVPQHLKQTTTSKYKQVIQCTQQLYDLRHGISRKVFDLRDVKYKTIGEITDEENVLSWIHQYIPEDLRQSGPQVVKYDESEFPEKFFEVNVVIAEDEASEEMEVEEEEGYYFVEPPSADELKLDILPRRSEYPPRKPGDKYFDVIDIADKLYGVTLLSFDVLVHDSKNEHVDTLYERELRVWLLNKLLLQQTKSIKKIHHLIKNFEDKVLSLNGETKGAILKSNVMAQHILALNQELTVLTKFEKNEHILEQKVQDNNTSVLDMKDMLIDLRNKINEITANIEESNVKMHGVLEKFTQATNSSKFYDFLKKVFKKKFKVPRIRTDDDSSSDSSSSSSDDSEEDDAASIDSRDFAFIKLDLNVCPKGCEQAIYDYTVLLRSKRYEIENAIKEDEKKIEMYRKEMEMNNKKLTQLDNILGQSKKELIEYQREKQRVLNQIMCTIVLRFDQIQVCSAEKPFENIEDCVVISKNAMTQLYKRVGQLQRETKEEKTKHQIYIKHLLRMKRDFKYMDSKIRKLKGQIAYQMFIKFGKVVDINEVEVNVLKSSLKSDLTDLAEICMKKMVYEVRKKNMDVKDTYDKIIAKLKKQIGRVQSEFIKMLRSNTARSELLRILNNKKNYLAQELATQDSKLVKFEKFDEVAKNNEVELKKIKKIIESQQYEIQDLKDEINMLKTKGYPPKPVRERRKHEVQEELEEVTDFTQFVDIEEKGEEKISTEIVLPDAHILSEAEDLIACLLEDLWSQTEQTIEKRSTENMAKEILERVLKCTSCHEIVRELIDNLPLEPSEDQLEVIEETAEKLLLIQDLQEQEEGMEFEFETEEEKRAYFMEMLDDIIDETMLIKGEPKEVIGRLLMRIVDNIPMLYLIRKQAIDRLVGVIGSRISMDSIKCDILPEIEDIAEFHKEDLRTVVSAVILKVGGSTEVLAREQVEEIVDEIMLEKGDTYDVMAHIVEKLVKSVPVGILMQEESFDNIAEVIKWKFSRKLHYEELLEGISSVELMHIYEVRSILNVILHKVYGTGLDFIYVVNNAKKYEAGKEFGG